MATFGFGLRAKALLALVLACLLAMIPAGLIGWNVLDSVRAHFGEAFAVNYTQLKRQNILAPVLRDLALSRRLADSVLVRQWLLDEASAQNKKLLFEEMEGFRGDLSDHSYFLISALSRNYYANDRSLPFSEQPRYRLEPGRAEDSWFFASMKQTDDYNINVNRDETMKVTKVWLNVIVRDHGRKIGLAGSGLDLSAFLKDFMQTREAGVTLFLVNEAGAIQAHRDRKLIATNQLGRAARAEQTLAAHLPEGAQRMALLRVMARAKARPGEVETLKASLDGKEQLLALSYIPELKWHVVTALDTRTAQVIDRSWLNAAVAALVLLIGVLLFAFAYAVDRLVLQPLRRLQHSASALSGGDYAVTLPPPSRDELGDLGRAFGAMASQIRANTEELENRVEARTRALAEANQQMQQAQQKIRDSIDYARLIQRAILPDQQLSQKLGGKHFVLWRPRDVVGGDFYLFRSEGGRHLIGVVDCAGHGVPGALMSMLARSALDQAMNLVGIASPAAILGQADAIVRSMLRQEDLPRAIATNMDAGLVHVDEQQRVLRYAGAKIGLYWSDGDEVGEVRAARRALGDRHQGVYQDAEIAMRPGVSYYLATDGILDQAGGEFGYGLGNTRFISILKENAGLPVGEQGAALRRSLEQYQGDHPQRDDITVLSFRFD